MEQSARAREIFTHFKATRQLSVLPTHAPPPDFEASVMRREQTALAELPLRHRAGRIVSMLAGYAMRPQLVMGALLLLMIASSLVFLRARPGLHNPIQITERGAPESEVDVLPLTPTGAAERSAAAAGARTSGISAPASPLPASSGEASEVASIKPHEAGLDPFEQALQLYRSGRHGEAQRRFERISRTSSRHAAEAALYAAYGTRHLAGCASAVASFERVRLRFPGTAAAHEATWRAAKCLQQLGDLDGARQAYQSLLAVGSHAERAKAALVAIGGPLPPGEPGSRPRAGQSPKTGLGDPANLAGR